MLWNKRMMRKVAEGGGGDGGGGGGVSGHYPHPASFKGYDFCGINSDSVPSGFFGCHVRQLKRETAGEELGIN